MAWIVVLVVVGVLLFLYFRYFKIPKIKNVVFVDGAPGAGKTFYCVNLAIRLYKAELRRYRVRKGILFVLSRLSFLKGVFARFADAYGSLREPMLYSNIPLRCIKFCPLTMDILLRKVTIPYYSVILFDEISICVDQFDYKDRDVSDALKDFFKLSRHQFRGHVVIDSQSVNDLHYSIKSVMSEYFYIHHRTKLPFISILSMQELAYSADSSANNIVNAFTDDLESTLKKVIVFNKYYRYYDSYCYSILTDSLPVFDDWYVIDKKESAKTRNVLTFKKGRYKVISNMEVSK